MHLSILMKRLTALLALFLAAHSQADDRPNIVFLMTDDQNIRSLGCYGAPGAITPNIDALAADGVVFTSHYDISAVCMTSRATVMTGLPEYRHGVNFDSGENGNGQMTTTLWKTSYPMLLKDAGYRIGFAGKFGFTVEDGTAVGQYPDAAFDAWGGSPDQTSYVTARNESMNRYAQAYPHATRSYGAFGRDFIRESARQQKPFCLSISFKAPHQPVQPDPAYDDVYKGAHFPKPGNFGREHGLHFSEQSRQGRQYARFETWHYHDNYDEVMAKYYQLIYAVDVAVGMIRKALSDADVADRTLIIFTSDNGYFCGAHGYGSKVLPYEESSRVPLIIYDPTRRKTSGRSNALTSNLDLAATILHAGAGKAAHGDGTSLLPVYAGKARSPKQIVPLINVWGPREVFSLGLVKGPWKYIYWPYSGEGMTPTAEMYHLGNDPLELDNRIDDTDQESAAARMELESEYDELVQRWANEVIERPYYTQLSNFFRRQDL